MRQRLIDSLCAMFNDLHDSAVSPVWLTAHHHQTPTFELIKMTQNWRRNYPELYAKHGIYVM